ncbi:hypothetical protein DMH27_00485 [Raoultella planticola]|nr:hypothetical protein [Raoultella planticola]
MERGKTSGFRAMFCGDNHEDSGDRPYDIRAEILYSGEIPAGLLVTLFYSADKIPPWLRDYAVNIVVDPSHFSFR